MTDSLSEMGSPAVTTRSSEDEDLLQQSMKMTKRGRNRMDETISSPIDGAIQEIPFADVMKSPDSNQWLTPVETPNTAWGRKEPSEPVEEELISDEESMDQDKANPNCPVIPVTKEEKTHLRCPWRRTLIIRVLGRKVAYSYLLQRLQKMWKPEVSFDLSAINQDYFLVRFEALHDYEFAKFQNQTDSITRVQHQHKSSSR